MNGAVTKSCEQNMVMCTRRSCMKGVMCEPGGLHVNKMITCAPGCGCVNWLVMFVWSHA